jgi:hypothetical protein
MPEFTIRRACRADIGSMVELCQHADILAIKPTKEDVSKEL